MLQIQEIKKRYVTGDLTQDALDGVSLNLRDNEFVAILGPSGSGKTTLLNIIGGLDRYDEGNLIINGISTKKYKDKDWDSYRNHTIGFVFQQYNLIPHLSVLANVELALTISGIKASERRKAAKEALKKVGLDGHFHKKPNQLSGGQMQRVAIARALVNNPDILLADEPTGALDSDTSVQIMNLLKEVASDRLVVMVTHNPELANEYASRIVQLKDGKIISDSMPYEVEVKETVAYKNMGKSSMSRRMALSLSFKNLLTKKARTILTAFAGSIGIIGIALILSLSNGVNGYIEDIQKETMGSYPISIEEQTIDLTSFISDSIQQNIAKESEHDLEGVWSDVTALQLADTVSSSVTTNNLSNFKKYLDNKDSEIHQYVGENGIVYSYDTNFGVFAYDPTGEFVNTDGTSMSSGNEKLNIWNMMMSSTQSMIGKNLNFSELIPDKDGKGISSFITDNYDVIYGNWPEKYDEIVLITNANNEISATTLYQLGLLPVEEYRQIENDIAEGEKSEIDSVKLEYEGVCNHEFYLIPACDMYLEEESGIYSCIAENLSEIETVAKNSLKLKIVGIVKPTEDSKTITVTSACGYLSELTNYIIDYTSDSEIVKKQLDNPTVNILNGMAFSPVSDEEKIEDAKKYLESLSDAEKAMMYSQFAGGAMPMDATMLPESSEDIPADVDVSAMSEMQNVQNEMPDDETLLMVYDMFVSTGSYEDNIDALGIVDYETPSGISIYADSFEDKDGISEAISKYNETAEETDKITYTDYVGLLMSSVTTIVDVISYVLIAFVGVSLVVSSIMIGIITYISVLERTKEIGVLRAIGASKKNISSVFNAETFIIGLFAGVIGIGLSKLILIPGNSVIHYLLSTDDVNAFLPWNSAALLILLSTVLTMIGGFIPSRKAAKKDPVTALRSE